MSLTQPKFTVWNTWNAKLMWLEKLTKACANNRIRLNGGTTDCNSSLHHINNCKFAKGFIAVMNNSKATCSKIVVKCYSQYYLPVLLELKPCLIRARFIAHFVDTFNRISIIIIIIIITWRRFTGLQKRALIIVNITRSHIVHWCL